MTAHRKSARARRADIVSAARAVFLSEGFADVGLTDVATAGAVSRGLVYRHFPGGRSDLFLAVTEDLLGELAERLHYARSAPFSRGRRMEQVLAALFAFFQERPDAYRFLFRDVWAARDESIEASAVAARAPLVAEIAAVMAGADESRDEIEVASAGVLGFALAAIERAVAGQVDAETAWRVTCRFATSQMPE
ncbi:MAG TPA: TetR/AcrR family transcriptional regulator [Acidimicrobiales bacterium]|nr:TetR/AcrR family transcriptional regulator [Acidimicrobiales bacterium]